MDKITRLARPEILAMKPYSSARKEGEQQHITIFLDANENPYPPYPGVVGANRYPAPQPPQLLERFAALYGVEENQLLLTRGGDEAIDLLVRAFCGAGKDAILVNTPSFVMYETAATIQNATIFSVALQQDNHFQLDVDKILATCHQHPAIKLLFICSPNNPTGQLMQKDDIVMLATSLLGKALVIVDEAYVEFSGQPSLATYIPHHPNLIVLRTLSKEYSLAGERCGITIAHEQVIQILTRILPPYPLPVSSIRMITEAMSPQGIEQARQAIHILVAQRQMIANVLKELPGIVHIYPSDTNYLLIKLQDHKLLLQMMEQEGIKLRDRSHVTGLEGCVRFSVGLPEENQQLLQVFHAYSARLAS